LPIGRAFLKPIRFRAARTLHFDEDETFTGGHPMRAFFLFLLLLLSGGYSYAQSSNLPYSAWPYTDSGVVKSWSTDYLLVSRAGQSRSQPKQVSVLPISSTVKAFNDFVTGWEVVDEAGKVQGLSKEALGRFNVEVVKQEDLPGRIAGLPKDQRIELTTPQLNTMIVDAQVSGHSQFTRNVLDALTKRPNFTSTLSARQLYGRGYEQLANDPAIKVEMEKRARLMGMPEGYGEILKRDGEQLELRNAAHAATQSARAAR
jgi:hypothetical protein